MPALEILGLNNSWVTDLLHESAVALRTIWWHHGWSVHRCFTLWVRPEKLQCPCEPERLSYFETSLKVLSGSGISLFCSKRDEGWVQEGVGADLLLLLLPLSQLRPRLPLFHPPATHSRTQPGRCRAHRWAPCYFFFTSYQFWRMLENSKLNDSTLIV